MKIFVMFLSLVLVAGQAEAQSVVFKQTPIMSALQEKANEINEQEVAAREAAVQASTPQEPEYVRPKPVTLYGGKYKIVALVNNEVISSRDLQSAVNMFVANTGMEYNSKTKDMINHRVMQSLIDEKLKINEAKKNGIVVSDSEILSGLKKFAASNNIPFEKLAPMLKNDGIDMTSLRTKMEADLAWQKLIGKKLGSLSQITPLEIKKEKEGIKKDLQKSRYLVSEIVIPAKNAKDIYSLVSVLREDPRFELYAMQFSESASASRGGDLGWVNKDNLDSKIAQKLDKMKIGDISDPVRIGSKYYIMKINAKYSPKTDKSTPPSDDDVLRYLQNKKADEFVNRYTQDIRNKAIIEIRD